MHGKQIVFYDPDLATCRVAERALNATGSRVTVASSLGQLRELLDERRFDLAMVPYDSRQSSPVLDWLDGASADGSRCQVVLHATEQTEDFLPVLRDRRHIRNLIAKNSVPLEPDELIVTAEKLLRKDLFGIDKYLRWGVEPLSIHICEARSKPEYIREVSSYAASLGCSPRIVELTECIVDELVTNAIFNAPRNADGTPKYRELHRSEPLVLSASERAILQFACDGDFIAVSTLDPFGALDHRTVVDYLNRCLVKGPEQMSEASGGAGMGLFTVFQSVSKFVINLAPGEKTEVISLIDLRLSMKQFRQAAKSFHFFVEE